MTEKDPDVPPLFSIVVPTYDRPDFLRSALESVLSQTVTDYECIVVEDGPPESTAVLPPDSRFRLVRHERNKGVAAARNTGLRKARGRFVTFLDDDDLFTSDRLEVTLPHLSGERIVVCRRGGEDGSLSHFRHLEGDVADSILDGFTPHLGQTTVPRERCPLFDERYSALEDVEWWLRIAPHMPVTSVVDACYLTRLNEQPRHANGALERARCSRMLLEEHVDYFLAHPRARTFRYERLARLERGLGRRAAARQAAWRSLTAMPRIRHLRLVLAMTSPSDRMPHAPREARPPAVDQGDPPCLLLAEQSWGSALQAMRSLSSIGVPAYVGVVGPGEKVYRSSRSCSGVFTLQADTPEQLSRSIVNWAERVVPRSDVVVLPLSDRFVDLLEAARDSLPSRFRLALPEPGVVKGLIDKASAFTIAECAGLDVPPWIRVEDMSDLSAVDRLTFPVIIRPSHWSGAGESYFKFIVCKERGELQRVLREKLGKGACLIVQEYLDDPSREVQFGIVWRSADRRHTAVCTGRKRRESSDEGGVMAWGEAVDLPTVVDSVTRFLDRSGFVGMGGIELLHSRGRTWFVEFNPRLEAIHFLAKRAGLDTVLMAYRDLASGTVPTTLPMQSAATAWVGSAWFGRLRAHPAELPRAVLDRLRFGRGAQRIKAVWAWKDPGPGLTIVRILATRALLALAGRASLPTGRGRGR